MTIFWLNGEFHEATRAIDIADRGFLLGDGVFETMLLVDGAPAFLAAHLDRMRAAAASLTMAATFSDDDIAEVIVGLAARNGLVRGTGSARLTLTRGAGARGLAIGTGAVTPTLLLTAGAYDPPVGEVTLIAGSHRRNQHAVTAKWKTLNYLDNILAKDEAVKAGAEDALMFNTAGRAACASAANVFFIKDGAVFTPPVSEGALPGIARAVLLHEAKAAGIKIAERPVVPDDAASSAIFLTNSLIGLRAASLRGGAAFGDGARNILAALDSCYSSAMKRDLQSGARA